MRHRILVVGRDVELRARLACSLSAARYSVEIAESPAHACRIGLRGFGLAVVVPAGLGAEVSDLIDKLRTATGRAVLIVGSGSSPDPTQEIIDASDETALLARVSSSLVPAAKPEEAAAVLHFANYRLDLVGHSLVDEAGQEVGLTRGEFRLLREFAQRPGRVLSRDQLLQASAGRDAEAYDRSIDMLIMRLRRKIELDPKRPRLIVTIPGSGYKFTTPVRSAGPMDGPVPERNHTPAERTPAAAERRQITALCAELAPTSGSLVADPEELRTIIDTYRRRTDTIVTQFGGIVGQCVGREVFAYFGHPVAQEDAAERAINAGLALARNMGGAEMSPDLSNRVGIATGVVVADPNGEVIGDAPSDAGRMRSLAEPGQVVLAASTRQLGGRLFAYHAVEPMTLNGVAGPMTAWRVLGRSALASRSEALYDGTLAPLVGRAEERDLLLHAWLQAKSGEGRVVLLSGEPGIGKSRLLVELETRLATETRGVRYFCSPLHQGSALHPIIARWEQEAGFARGDTDEQRLCKLESVLAPDELSPTDVALIAGMLGVLTGERYRQPDLSPPRRKELTLAVLQRRLACLAQRQPVLILFEDAHWADYSSLEWLDTLVRQITELPILLVISFRPEFVPPWFGRAGVSLLMLTRLDRRQSAALAAQVTGAHPLTPALLERIIAQTDGVPLFIEELTKAMLETAADGSPQTLTVPSTLQASLMARLDRLPTARQVAQIGSVIGREFPYNLLVATAGLSEAQLTKGLDELIAAGLVFRRGLQHEAVYTFKHALVQETAYQSLLKARRQHIHRQIAETVRDQLLEQADAEPEIVAHHFTQADLPAQAVEWWGKAGELALRRPAYSEALSHLEQALRLADGLGEEGSGHKRSRLRLQITYGNALRMARGFGVPETQAAFVVARDLAAAVEDVSERFPAYFGLWNVSFVRADLIPMQDVAATFLRDVESEPQSPDAAMAHRICGTTSFYEGNFVAARQHLEQVLAICNAVRDCEPVFRFGLDVASPAMTYLALTLWALGRFGCARSLMEEAVARALETGHIPTIALAHDQAAGFEMLRRDRLRTAPHAHALLSLAREHGMPVWIANGMFRNGWSRWDADQEAGMAEMRQGIALLRLQQHEVSLPTMMTLLAETEAEAGHPDAGLTTIEMQLATIERTGQRWPLAQLHRMRGEILLKCGPGDAPAAESAFVRAIDIARGQQAKGFELQAAVSLARLWVRQGKRAQALELLAPVCAWFGEGLDCDAALREARSLQSDLAAK